MNLLLPGTGEGRKTSRDDHVLACQFWKSRWGLEATGELDADPWRLVIRFLTAKRELGGLQASWDAGDGLDRLLRWVGHERPFCLVNRPERGM
jgi:hypothetical protein